MPGILDNITRPEATPEIDLASLLNTNVFNNINPSNVGKGFGTLSDVPNVDKQQGYMESRLDAVKGYDNFESSRFFNPDAEDIDNIRDYAVNQGTGEYAGNLLTKFGKTTWNSFLEGFKQNSRNINALTSWDAEKLYNSDDEFTKQMEKDRYALPTFGTGENDNSWTKYLPWSIGKSDFYGEMIPQLGFTIGTMGQALLENAAIMWATGGLGELAMTSKNAWTAARLGKGFNNLWESANGIKNLKRGLSSLAAISKEKNLGYNLAQTAKSIANGYAMYNTAAGEASFEAGNNYNETKDALTQEFIQENGYQPFGEDEAKIDKVAKSAAISTFGWNIPVLMASNLIQFNNIIKPFKSGEAAILDDVAITLNRAEKRLEAVKKVPTFLSKVKWGAKGILEPLSEGFEESTQAIISKSSSDYYKNIVDAANPSSQLWDSIHSGLDYATSDQGFDEFVGGLIGGALFKGVGKINEKLEITSKLGFDTNKDKKKRKELIQEQAIEVLNNTTVKDVFNYLQNSDNANLINQVGHTAKMQNAVKEGSRLDYNDAKDASIREFIYAGLRTGKLDIKLSTLDLLNEMTDEQIIKEYNIKASNDTELQQKVEEKRQELAQQVQAIKDKAYSLQDEYIAVEKKYGNKYQAGTDEHNAWEEAKKARVFSKDAIESDRNRSKSLKDRVQTITEGKLNSKMMDVVLDQNLRDQYIKSLEPYTKIPISEQSPEMKDKIKEYNTFIYLDDMLKNTSVAKKGISNRIAKSLYSLNRNHKYDLSDTEPGKALVNDIEDILKIEIRNRKNIEVYNYLNGKGFEKEFEEHLKAQQASQKAIEENKKQKPIPQVNISSEELINNLKKQGYTITTDGEKVIVKNANSKVTYKDQKEFLEKAPLRFKETPKEVVPAFTGQTPDFDSQEDEANSKGPAAKIVTEAGLTDSSKYAEQSAEDINPLDPNYHRRKDLFLERLQEETLVNPDTNKAWSKDEVITLIISRKNRNKYFKETENSNNIFQGSEDVDTTPVVFIFVNKRDGNYYPISVDGKLSITPLSPEYEVSFDNVVYSYATQSSEAKFTYKGQTQASDLRPVPGTKESDAIQQYKDAENSHRERRKEWIDSENGVESPFVISQGLSNRIKGQEYVRNSVEDATLTTTPSNDNIVIFTTQGDKDGYREVSLVNGTKRRVKIGRPYFVTKNTKGVISYTHLDNRRFTENEKDTIKNILLYLSTYSGDFTKTAQYNFLKSIMFFGKEGISIDTKEGFKVVFDGKDLTLVEDSTIPQEFDDWLSTKYMNITLPDSKGKDMSFIEFFTSNNKLKDKKWKDYGSYLMTKRENTPLTVDILSPEQVQQSYEAANGQSNPYPTKRKQRYIILGSERKTDSGKKKEEKVKLNVTPVGNPVQAVIDYLNNLLIERVPNIQKSEEVGVFIPSLDKKVFGKQIIDLLIGKKKQDHDIPILKQYWNILDKSILSKEQLEAIESFLEIDNSKTEEITQVKEDEVIVPPVQVVETATTNSEIDRLNAEREKELIDLLPKDKISTGSLDFSAAFHIGIPEFYQQMFDMVKEGKDTIAGVKESNAPLLQKLYNDSKLKDKKDVWLALNPEANKINAKYDGLIAALQTSQATEQSKPAGLFSNFAKEKRAPKGRTKLQEEVTNYTPEDIDEIKAFFKKNLPQVALEFVPELIKLADGNLAWGVFYDSTVQVFEQAMSGTGYHEAFEVVFGGILNRKQQSALLSQMKKREGSFQNFATNGIVKYSEASDSQLREEMAEEFMRFKKTGVVKEDNRNFFQKLIDFIKSFILGIDRINEVFTKLDEGYYSQKVLSPLRDTRTRKFTNLSPLETLKYLKSFSYEIVDSIVSATSFNRFDNNFDVRDELQRVYDLAENFYNNEDENDESGYKWIVASALDYKIEDINKNSSLNDKEKENKINNVAILAEQDWLKKQDTWNNKVKPQWSEFIGEQLKYLKQLGILKTVEQLDDSETDQEEKNNEYTKDAFVIDVKQTAPSSVRLAFNTIAQSVFDFENISVTIEGDVELPNIVNKVDEFTGLSMLYNDSKQLFNTIITSLAGSLTLEQMKNRLEDLIQLPYLRSILDPTLRAKEVEKLSKANPAYVHLFKLYQRVFGRQELTEDDIAFRLKFLSTFQKQKPTQYFLNVEQDGNVFLMDGSRDSGARAAISYWNKNLTRWQKSKDNKHKIAKRGFSRSPFTPVVANIEALLNIPLREDFIKKSTKELGITLKKDTYIDDAFLDSLNNTEKDELYYALRTILEVGFLKGLKNSKVVSSITHNKLGVSGPYGKVAEIILSKTGDNTEQVMSNIEGEQQQLLIQNNTVSTVVSEIFSVKDKEELYLKYPWFKDAYIQNSVRLKNNTPIKVVTIQGTQDKKPSKSSNQGLSERLLQEFNVNLAGVHYVLVPADSETEWAIEGDNIFSYSNDLLDLSSNMEVFLNYLKDEINFAKDFLDNTKLKRKDERLNVLASVFGGEEQRKIGASLQLFKDILSQDVVNMVHSAIDNNHTTEDIVNSLEDNISDDIKEYFQNRITETFQALNKSRIVDVVNPKGSMYPESIIDSNYYFHGMLSEFGNKFTKTKTIKDGKKTTIFKNTVTLSKAELENVILYRELNYVANNIEATKLFFGNPTYYKDILKRVKSGLSPKQNSATESDYDNWFTNNLNQGLQKDHLHYHEFKPYINTWVFKDHKTYNPTINYSTNNATDAQSFMTPKAYREFYWKNGASFRPTQESAYQVMMALDRRLMDEDGIYPYTTELRKKDDALLKEYVNDKNQLIKELPDVFEIFKPLGMGQLYSDEQLPFIWKTSVGMMTYASTRNTPMGSAYIQMLNNNIDVLTFESAWKVGLKMNSQDRVENLLDLNDFNNLGKVKDNIDSFVHKMPFNYVGRQVETSSQKNKSTIGTQTTKLALTDLFLYGIPTDYMQDEKNFQKKSQSWYTLTEQDKLNQSNHYRLENKHRKEIMALENKGYYNLLAKLGIKENSDGTYESYDPQVVYDLLIEEMVKRGLSPNIYEMLEEGATVSDKPLEALSNYSQASFIIMSLVRKNIIRPKLNGGQKIQLSSALLNKAKGEKLDFYLNKDEEWIKIETEEQFNNLSSEEKEKLVPTSNQLKFYSKNEDRTTNAMEVMISYSNFDKVVKYRESKGLDPISKEDLISYINKNQKELAKGIGFRIPTQALSSIDTFIIKGFLPEWMGDAIAVPSELTTKSGSDFDVDKLNTYLNNYYISAKGWPKYIKPDLEVSEEANDRRWVKYNRDRELLNIIDESIADLTRTKEISERNAEAFFVSYLETIEKTEEELESIEDLLEDIEFLNKDVVKKVLQGNGLNLSQYNNLKRRVDNLLEEAAFKAQDVYLQNSIGAIENSYFSTIDEILKLERNFDKLLSPNSSDEFSGEEGTKNKLIELKKTEQERLEGKKAKSYVNHAAILDSNYMRYQRWAFVSGKKGVGIAALSSTNHVNSQKIGFKFNKGAAKYDFSYKAGEQESFGLHLPHNQVVIDNELVSVLSGVDKADGKNISEYVSKYVNGYVDVSKDTWVLEMGATLDVAGIFLMMERLGIDSDKIVLFMNQPVVRNFIELKVLKNSSIRRINPLLNAQLKGLGSDDTIFEYIKKEIWPKGAPKSADDSFEGDFSNSSMEEAITKRVSHPSTLSYLKAQDEETKLEQYRILKQFMILSEQANYIRGSQQASNYDTFNLNSLSQMDIKEELIGNLYENPLVSTIQDSIPMPAALIHETFVSNILSKLNTLDQNFISNIFKIQSKNIRLRVLEAIKELRPDFKYKSENDKRDLASKVNQVILNYLNAETPLDNGARLQNYFLEDGTGPDSGVQLSQDNLTGLLSNTRNAIKDNPDFKDNKWLSYLTVQQPDETSDYGYYSLNLDGKPGNKDTAEHLIWLNDFERLYQNASTSKLAKYILMSSMLTAGAEYNRENISNFIPWQHYFKYFSKALENAENVVVNMNIARDVARLKAFDEEIVPSLQYFGKTELAKPTAFIRKGDSYVEISNDKDKPEFAYRAENTNSILVPYSGDSMDSILLLPVNSFDSRNNYFTIKQPKAGLTQEEVYELQKAKADYSTWQTQILFENQHKTIILPKGEFNVFIPIQIKGDRYFQEISSSPYSILNKNQKVNPELTNVSYLDNALKTLGSVQKESSLPNENAVSLQPMQQELFKQVVDEFTQADKLTPIEQNFKDGQGGRQMQDAYKGKSTMELIQEGIRTRTTRANTDVTRIVKEYNLSKFSDLVGKVIRMTDKEGNEVYTRITGIHKFTQEYQDATWQQEGWKKEVTDKLVGQYPYAIEFEVANLPTKIINPESKPGIEPKC